MSGFSDPEIQKILKVAFDYINKAERDPRVDDVDPIYILAAVCRVVAGKMIFAVGEQDFSTFHDEIKWKTIQEFNEFTGKDEK